MLIRKKYLKHLFFPVFLLIPCFCLADPKTDSLKQVLSSNISDSLKIKTLLRLSDASLSPDESIDYANQALSLNNQGKYPELRASAYICLGNAYIDKGQLEKAISAILKGMNIYEKNNLKSGLIDCYSSLGIVYNLTKNYKKAIIWKKKALDLSILLHDESKQARCATTLANTYLEQEEYVLAISYYNEAYAIFEKIKDENSKQAVLNNIAAVYFYKQRFDKAAEIYKQLLGFALEAKDTLNLAVYYNNLGECFSNKNEFKTALEYFKKSELFVKNLNNVNDAHFLYLNLSTIYKKLGDYKNAFEYKEITKIYEDSIFNMENSKQFHEMTVKYESETKEKENLLLGQTIKLKDVESSRQQIAIISIGIILLIVACMVFILNKQNRTKQRINKQLAEKNHIIEEQHKDITDSIQYSKRIQEAIMPSLHVWEEILPDSFILYKPKDVLSGDFYWLEKTKDVIYFAACDCTGHGVPGAMVSVICSTALNRSVKEFNLKNTGEILDKVRELVLETFEKSESNVQDGMDISVCALNTKTRELLWSGANNPLWYLQNNEAKEVTANKQPIGKVDNPTAFTTHSIQLNKNDIIYLFTDGYADQFGGPKGKKFKYKQLKELILNNASKKMREQREILLSTFETWKGNLEQVDDVCIIGVRV